LLKLAVEAHGGLSAWEKLQGLRANVSVGGALWDLKHTPGLFAKINVELKLRYQQVLTHLLDDAQKMVFTPHQVSLESESGETIETRDDPKSAFGQSAETKWDKLHAGYFNSYALWGYLTTPFLYTYPGFDAREIDPWHENGERWRVLRVTFPDGYATHTRTQYYFGETGFSEDISHCRCFRRGQSELRLRSIARWDRRDARPDDAFSPTTTLGQSA
jgi:hypothetical protein